MFVYKYVCYVVSILVFMLVGVVLIVKGQAECCTPHCGWNLLWWNFFLSFGISCFRKVHVPAIVVDFLK